KEPDESPHQEEEDVKPPERGPRYPAARRHQVFQCADNGVDHKNAAGTKIKRLTAAQKVRIASVIRLRVGNAEPGRFFFRPANQRPAEPSKAGGANNTAAPCNAHTCAVPQAAGNGAGLHNSWKIEP